MTIEAREPLADPDQLQSCSEPTDEVAEAIPHMRRTLREVLNIAVPNTLRSVMTLINEVTNIVCLGHAGNDAALAAVGLGNMMQNCFGLSIGFGVAAALDTLVSQAHGGGRQTLCVHYLQRCRVLLTMQLVWMIPVLWTSDKWLVLLHEDTQVSRDAAQYNRVTVFGFFFVFQYECTSKFLNNCGKPSVSAVISSVCSILHIAWAVIFVVYLGMGNAGAGYANVVTWFLQFLLSCVYLVWNAPKMNFSKWQLLFVQAPAFREWGAFLRIALPATLQLCSEWWFFEICALIVGYFGSTALAAHVSTMSFITVVFMPSIGVNTAASTVVGNSLGANLPRKARQAAWLCVMLAILVWTAIGSCTLLGRKVITSAYADDHGVQDIMQKLLVIYSFAGYFDNTQNVMGGCLRGMGMNKLPAAIYLVGFYGIMLPVACCLAWPLKMGVYGIWWSMPIGTGIAVTVFSLTLRFTDWNKAARDAEERMKDESVEAATKEDARVFSMSMQNAHTDERLVGG